MAIISLRPQFIPQRCILVTEKKKEDQIVVGADTLRLIWLRPG